jgi:hypothetical protein
MFQNFLKLRPFDSPYHFKHVCEVLARDLHIAKFIHLLVPFGLGLKMFDHKI